MVSFPLEDKHVVNEHYIIKNVMMPQNKNALTWCISTYHMIVLKETRSIKNVTLKTAKNFVGIAVYWEE